mgnify:CR=1 FL=1
MEDIQIFDFIVKSSIHDYDVNFIDDFRIHLNNNLLEGDHIIIDNNILNIYKEDLKVLEDFNFIGIDSNENQKSYEGLIPIIDSLINNGFIFICSLKYSPKGISVPPSSTLLPIIPFSVCG